MRLGRDFPILPIFPFEPAALAGSRSQHAVAANTLTQPGKSSFLAQARKKIQNADPANLAEAAGLQPRFVALFSRLAAPGRRGCADPVG